MKTNNITILINQNVLASEAIDLWVAINWGIKEDYKLEQVEKALKNTTCIISTRNQDGRLVGLTRILSDGIIHTTIADIVIHPDFQKLGIGKMMIQEVKRLYGKTGIFLETFKGNELFFEKCGFNKKDNMVVLSKVFEK